MKFRKIMGAFALVIVVVLMAGCSGNSQATPTTDPKQVLTQVAQEVQAQITNAAKLTPKPTNTIQPTETRAASATSAATAAGTRPAVTVTGTPPTATKTTPGATQAVLPTATSSAGGPLPTVPDKMAYISQSVADGSVFIPSQGFSITWVIKNSGTTTWTEKYTVRLYGGERMNVADFQLGKVVKPNETINITMEMKAPPATGKYNTWWVLSTAELVNFGSFNLSFEVK